MSVVGSLCYVKTFQFKESDKVISQINIYKATYCYLDSKVNITGEARKLDSSNIHGRSLLNVDIRVQREGSVLLECHGDKERHGEVTLTVGSLS